MLEKEVFEILGGFGRMISGSKSGYRQARPSHYVVFNANVVTKEHGKIWYGDLDLTLDMKKLREVARVIGKTIYVLYEMDGRFMNKDTPKLDAAIVAVDKDGQAKFLRDLHVLGFNKDGDPVLKC